MRWNSSGKELHHRLAVLQHVGDAGRRARIVLEHEELVLAGAHDVDADDVGVDAGRRPHADHLGQERLVPGDQLLRDAAGAQDFLAVVDVVEEGVERLHALLDALRQPPPFGAGNDARHDVEGDQPFGRLGLAIDGEGDAGLAENPLGVAHLFGKPRRVLRLSQSSYPEYALRSPELSGRISSNATTRLLPYAVISLARCEKCKRNRASGHLAAA